MTMNPQKLRNISNHTYRKRWFLISAALILCTTALAKLVSATGQASVLQEIDPIFGLPFTVLLFGVGMIELTVGALCLSRKHQQLATVLTAWLCISFITYRFGLWWIGWQKPCHCLGNFTDAIGIPASVADILVKMILVYLTVGTFFLLSGPKNQPLQQKS